MERNRYEIVLQTISTGLVDKIIAETGLGEDAVMEQLYSSALYSILEKEESKAWHYSVPMLYELYNEEATTGGITFPDF